MARENGAHRMSKDRLPILAFMPYWTTCGGTAPFRLGAMAWLLQSRAVRTADGAGACARQHHLGIGHLRHFAQVVLRAGRVVVEEDLLGDAPAQRRAHPIEQLLGGQQVLVARHLHRVAQSRWRRGRLGTAPSSFQPRPVNAAVAALRALRRRTPRSRDTHRIRAE